MGTTSTDLRRPEVAQLADLVDGRVLHRGDDGYGDAVTLFNAAIANRPDIVVQAESTSDVVLAVRYARERGLDLSVKGGGHGVAGLATAGRLVIDLSRMRGVSVDPARRRAVAQEAACSATSTPPPSSTVWRHRPAGSRTPASPASPSAAGRDGCRPSTG